MIQLIEYLDWYHWVILILTFFTALIATIFFYSYFNSKIYMGVSKGLDKKQLSIRIDTLKHRLLSLDTKESIEEDLVKIRKLENDLDEEPYDFDPLIKTWEDTVNKVNERGYI
jgi:hypothetical protein